MPRLDDALHDLRHAVRTFRREPAFVVGVVLTFALAIGMNAAMFGLVERLMLAPPPGIRDAERVVRLMMKFTGDQGETYAMSTTSYPAYRGVSELHGAFDDVAASRADTMTTGQGAELSEIAVLQASGSYFSVLGARPAIGRLFGPSDDETPDGSSVVVLSHAYWQRRFAGERSALGSRLIVDDQPFTVIGVAAEGFNGDELSAVDLFMPLTAASRGKGPAWFSDRGMRIISVLGRLRPGVSPIAASAMVTAALRDGTAAAEGDRLTSSTLEAVAPGRSARQSPQARIALWLTGVSLVVLVIATANVATLLLLRNARRRRETAVRITLGASRGRLARQSLLEGLLLALLGCAAGLLVARWFGDVVRVTLLPNVAASVAMIDGPVLLASIIAACGAGLLAGAVPLVRAGRHDLSTELRAGGGHGASGRFMMQHVLVALQVTLCTLLLVGAGLFVRSLQRVRSQDLGFSTARLLHVTLAFRGKVPAIERDAAHAEAVRRVQSMAGVTGVTVVQGMPFAAHHIPPFSIPGAPDFGGGQPPIMYGATPAYLAMMGVVLREGRLITARDTRGAPLVVLVNETMARNAWPGRSALGKCVRAGFGPGFDLEHPEDAAQSAPCREVVGVVRDSRARSLRLERDEGRLMQYYVPFAQLPTGPFPDEPAVYGILVQTADPARLAPSVQRVIQGGSPVPLYARVRPYQELIDPQLRSWRLGATLFSAFGALALGIAAVGLFAVVSYLVTQRTQEIGVRLALGGTRLIVGRLVVWDAVRMAGSGAVAGVVIAMSSAPLVQGMLFQTSAREPATVIAATACCLPCAASSRRWPPRPVLRQAAPGCAGQSRGAPFRGRGRRSWP